MSLENNETIASDSSVNSNNNNLQTDGHRPYATSANLKELFIKDFDKLNNQHDDKLTKNEIDTAVTNNSIHGEDAQLVVALKEYFGPLSKIANDHKGGITLADIDAFDQVQKRVHNPVKGEKQPTQAEANLVNGIDYVMLETKYAAQTADHCLYGNPTKPETCVLPEAVKVSKNPNDNGIDSVSPTAFRQGRIGDCYFEAALCATAAVDKQSIVKMIKDNHDGSYTVTFPISPKEPITVGSPTEAERALYTRTFSYDNPKQNYGDWPIIMEKAFGKWCNDRPLRIWRRSPSEWLGKIIPQENADGGSMYHRGLVALTGELAHTDYCWNNNEEVLDKKLQKVFASGRPVTAFISRRADAIIGLHEDLTDDAKLLCGHEYGVLDYDSSTKQLTIREPNGYYEPCKPDGTPEDGVRDGVFKISLTRFRKNFTGLSYPRK